MNYLKLMHTSKDRAQQNFDIKPSFVPVSEIVSLHKFSNTKLPTFWRISWLPPLCVTGTLQMVLLSFPCRSRFPFLLKYKKSASLLTVFADHNKAPLLVISKLPSACKWKSYSLLNELRFVPLFNIPLRVHLLAVHFSIKILIHLENQMLLDRSLK